MIYVNEQKVTEGKISKTVPFIFYVDETTDVGGDIVTPVSATTTGHRIAKSLDG